jgi:hypothetical protein
VKEAVKERGGGKIRGLHITADEDSDARLCTQGAVEAVNDCEGVETLFLKGFVSFPWTLHQVPGSSPPFPFFFRRQITLSFRRALRYLLAPSRHQPDPRPPPQLPNLPLLPHSPAPPPLPPLHPPSILPSPQHPNPLPLRNRQNPLLFSLFLVVSLPSHPRLGRNRPNAFRRVLLSRTTVAEAPSYWYTHTVPFRHCDRSRRRARTPLAAEFDAEGDGTAGAWDGAGPIEEGFGAQSRHCGARRLRLGGVELDG